MLRQSAQDLLPGWTIIRIVSVTCEDWRLKSDSSGPPGSSDGCVRSRLADRLLFVFVVNKAFLSLCSVWSKSPHLIVC